MKIRHLLLVLLLVLGIFSTTFAQAPVRSPQNPPVQSPNQCNDGKDNGDGDNLADDKDPDCKTGVKCEDGTTKCITQAGTGTSGTTSGSDATDFDLKVRINNPLKVGTISEAISLFMNAVLRIAIPFIIIFFIWSGLSFILARGNPEKIKTAKNMFWYTVIGTLLILGAWTITNAIIGTVNSITG
ncbi:MAG: hypothetical protein KBC11_01085 [Candidatus Pacebacteria bacterium]|nr:hypothetical protein [Candidatus Paceibacterota bacterium]